MENRKDYRNKSKHIKITINVNGLFLSIKNV